MQKQYTVQIMHNKHTDTIPCRSFAKYYRLMYLLIVRHISHTRIIKAHCTLQECDYFISHATVQCYKNILLEEFSTRQGIVMPATVHAVEAIWDIICHLLPPLRHFQLQTDYILTIATQSSWAEHIKKQEKEMKRNIFLQFKAESH